jgi:ribosome-associated toxin RatA of RatAB toxin-antitoxin module
MKTVNKSVLIWYSVSEMYALVADVTRYPEFLPWCDHATILSEHAGGLTAELGLSMAGLRQRFTTRNELVPDQSVGMALVDGPFSELDGEWRFHPVGDASQRACRVNLELRYGFDNAALAALVGPIFDKVTGTLVDAFVKRAEQVYG